MPAFLYVYLLGWWNGRHERLKISCSIPACGFESRPEHHKNFFVHSAADKKFLLEFTDSELLNPWRVRIFVQERSDWLQKSRRAFRRLRIPAPSTTKKLRRHGGVVTQRPAKPCTPVRSRMAPPTHF